MSATLADLPDDVKELIAPHIAENPATLDAISVEIASKRDEAKSARASSGIEANWTDAEEAYIGIDDANRHEFGGERRWAKPTSPTGPVSTGRSAKQVDHKSTVYLRLTSRYVDAGAAKLAEILLPADDKAFSFSETPVPELIDAQEDDSQVVHSGLGVPLTRPPAPGEAVPPSGVAPQPGQPQPPSRVPLTVKDLAVEHIEMVRKRAKAAETRIWGWMVENQYTAEARKIICDAARIGVGVIEAPTPKAKRVMAVTTDGDEIKVIIKDKITPAALWVDPWNIYPDPACGENIHDGSYIFKCDYMSPRQVRGLKKLPGYISDQIDKVLEEGPDKSGREGDYSSRGPASTKNKGRFQVWYFYGTLTKDEMATINVAAGMKDPSNATESDEVYAIVTLINDSVVRATINPLDSGSFPFHSMPWQRRAQSWAGVGVAEQMRTPQKVTNAALRALLNNAGKSAGSQIVLDQSTIRPADGNWTITPDKLWFLTEAGGDVSKAFKAFEIPNVTAELMQIIELGERFAEETTSIPLITQGQSGATTPDTFGAAQLQNNNANQLLRSIGYAFDDHITEPVVRQFYEWLLLDPDVPNEEKAEFQINAHGSIALVERAIQDQTIAQMAALVLNPAYGFNPKKWATEFARSKRLNPETLLYSKEEQERIDAAPPPEAPVVTAAKIGADTQIKLGVMKQQGDQQTIQSEERIEAAANALEGKKADTAQQGVQVDATIRLHELQMRHELALMDYANARGINFDTAKMQLAKSSMQLQTERELNMQNNQLSDRKHRREIQQRNMPKPPIQAPGRAANGHAFDQSVGAK